MKRPRDDIDIDWYVGLEWSDVFIEATPSVAQSIGSAAYRR